MASLSYQAHPPPSAAADPRAEQLVMAAYDLLDQAGLEGLTIRAVLSRTGLARRAFYDNFTGKDELLLAVFEQTIRQAAAHYRQIAETLPGPMARLEMIVVSIASGSANNAPPTAAEPATIHHRSAAMSREHLRLAEARPDELQAALAPLRALIVEQLQAGMAAGEMRPADPHRQAALIYNLVSTTAHAELLAEEGETPDHERRRRLAHDVWAFCRRAIAV